MSDLFKRMNEYVRYISLASYVFHNALAFYYLYLFVPKVRDAFDRFEISPDFPVKMMISGMSCCLIVMLWVVFDNKKLSILFGFLILLLAYFLMDHIHVVKIRNPKDKE